MFSCKFAAYFQNIFSWEHVWVAVSESWNVTLWQAVGGQNSTFKNKDKSFFLLPNEEKLRKAWLGAINRKDKLPKNDFHWIWSLRLFEEKSFDASWKLQNELSRSSRSQMFFKLGVLKNFAMFQRKTAVLEPLFNKDADLKPCLQLY